MASLFHPRDYGPTTVAARFAQRLEGTALHRPLHRPSKLQVSTIIALSFNHYQLHICQAASTCIITQMVLHMLFPQRQRQNDKIQICRRKGLCARGGGGRVRRTRASFKAKGVSAAGDRSNQGVRPRVDTTARGCYITTLHIPEWDSKPLRYSNTFKYSSRILNFFVRKDEEM